MEEKKLKIGKININYKIFELENNENNIIILHGWGGSSDSWKNVGTLLVNNGFNVIVPDLPGFGKTKLDKIYDLDKYSKLIEDFINKLSIKNFILWGHSNGGAISIKIVNRNNLKIERLVLNNSAGIRNDKKRSLKRKILNNLSHKIKKINFIKNKDNKILSKLRTIFYKIIGGGDYLNAEKNPFLKQTYLNMISSDLIEEIKNIKQDTLLIWGENDTYTPLSDGNTMRKYIKNSKIVVINNEKHGIHLKNPEKLIQVFLNNI